MTFGQRIATALIPLMISPWALAAPVNVNTAGAEEIAAALNGIGPGKAQAIVDYRKANGPYKSATDLSAVKGIGEKTVAKNAKDIQL